ncbi:hypothetical protein BG015_008917 [Linnemannia schmuckeri]|uniref:Ion transport domain-containing protein n=1 Tax=Linnemannia schmuckeri TaxID=64567 RepID=A0A9P5RWN1_9FUNG|nr:hypothetical protein BG015_008917 [Linnemannia schmuckeri]
MNDAPLDTPSGPPLHPPSMAEDTNDTTPHVFVVIPLDVQMDESSESVEEEKNSDETVTNLNVAPSAPSEDEDEDSDNETSALSIHHQTQGSGDTVVAAVDPELSDNSHESVFSPGEDENKDSISTSTSNFIRQWFFKDLKTKSPLPARQLELVSENQEEYVNIEIASDTETQSIEWKLPVGDIPSGSFELILGISSRDLDLKAVDSITFGYVYDDTTQKSTRPSEVIPSSTLKTLFATSVPRDDISTAVQDEESDEPAAAQSDGNSVVAQEEEGGKSTMTQKDENSVRAQQEDEEKEESKSTNPQDEGSPTTAPGNDDNLSVARKDRDDLATAQKDGDELAAAQTDEGESTTAEEGNVESDVTAGKSNKDNTDPDSPPTILRWKLHEKVSVKSATGGTIKIIMTIETWKGISLNPGAIGLHFLELFQDSFKSYQSDSSYRRHNPFAWYIDVNAVADSPPNDIVKEIVSYCFSGNGAYVAMLTHSTAGQHLDLYHIDQDIPSSSLVESWKLSSSKTIVFDISVSWDGSQVVVLNLTRRGLSAVYSRQKPKKRARASSSMASGYPGAQYSVGNSHAKISKQYCRGTFHVSAPISPDQEPSNSERFITFDGITMSIYSVHGKWKLLDTRTIGQPEDSIDADSKWKDRLQSGRLVLECGDGMYISSQSLTGTNGLIAAMDLSTTQPERPYITTSLSKCGGFFVMASKEHIDLYLTDTWTRLGSWTLPNDIGLRQEISNVFFTNEGQRIVISTTSDLSSDIHSQGYVVDISTMDMVGRIHSRGLRHHSHAVINLTDSPASVLLYRSQTTLGAIRYTDRLIRSSSGMATKCNDQCSSMDTFQPPTSPVFQAEVIVGTVEPRDRRKVMPMISVAAQEADSVHKSAIEFPRSEGTRLLGIQRSHFNDHSILVITLNTLVLVWRIPKVHDGEYELILAEGNMLRTKWSVCRHHQLHKRDRSGVMSTRNLLDPLIHDSNAFLDGIVRLAEIFKDADEMSKHAMVRYVERHINQRLRSENDSAAILIRLCNSWTPESHERLLVFIGALCGSPSFRWVPALNTGLNANPILILLNRLQNYLYIIDIVEVMINYCVRQAKADSDLQFLGPVFHSLRIALEFHKVDAGLMSRALRTFAYFPAREYNFAIDHHAIASTPFESNADRMLHEWKDPVLQLTSKPAGVLINERLTPYLFVASYDMLWTVEEIPVPKRRDLAILQKIILILTSTSRKRYVCHPFELEDLDNPALVALVRYKWMKFGLMYWLLKTVFYGYIGGFFLFTVIWDIYFDYTSSYMRVVRDTNMALSWIFALGSFRELVVLIILKMKLRGKVYRAVEILSSLIPTIGYLTGSHFVYDMTNSDVYRFILCLSVLILMLQFLFEFRVMRKVGSFLSVLGRTFRSIWVLLGIFAYLIIAYAISFLYMKYGLCIDDSCSNRPDAKPDNPFIATTLTYFMTGGLYEMAETDIKNRNWMAHILLATFLFSVTIMLNILIGMVNHAFDSDGKYATLEWMENRMYLVTRAENTLRGLPFISQENSLRFPKSIYYTATPQQVRDYRAESQRLTKEATSAALPLESDSHNDDSITKLESLKPKPEYAFTTSDKHAAQQEKQEHQQEQEMGQDQDQQDRLQQAWVDHLEEMTVKFREELRAQLEAQKRLADEELEAQKRQADERIEQVQAQLSEILCVLRAGVGQ